MLVGWAQARVAMLCNAVETSLRARPGQWHVLLLAYTVSATGGCESRPRRRETRS
jgi:hypothetical protein